MKETVGRKAERGEETTVTERAARAGKEMVTDTRGRGVEVAAEKGGAEKGRRKEGGEETEAATMIMKEVETTAEIAVTSEIGSLNYTFFPKFSIAAQLLVLQQGL